MKFEKLQKFANKEDGAMTALGLTLGVSFLAIGGLGLDVANAYMARTQLQVAADSVAHAALYYREFETAADSKIAAVALAEVNLPYTKYGSTITANDISFGYWDAVSESFQVDSSSKDGVMVDIARVGSRGNGLGTYFLKFAGFDSWDVRRAAVFETYIPTCFREGFVADDVVDVQSNNSYVNGFCVHSNTHVEINSNNTFEDNTVVSMPDKNDVVLPSSGFSSNVGLQSALRDGSYQIRILNRLADIIDGLAVGDPDYTPDYITSTTPIVLGRNLNSGDFTPGRIHTVQCRGGQHLQFSANAAFQDTVLVTNCRIHFASGASMDNSIIATTYTNTSIWTGADFTLGRDDHCAADGGSQILSLGTVDFSAGLNVYGGQIIALGDIEFSANADGIEGASFIAGGTVSGTTNMTMGFCGSGMERNFEAEYFRLAI